VQFSSSSTMPHSFGRNAQTRSKFARPFRARGPLNLTTFLRTYKIGDYVDIKVSGNVHHGLPHRIYHGKTGKVWNVTPRSVGVIILKRVKFHYIEKKIHVRIEHVSPSKCQKQHKERVKANDSARRQAKTTGKRMTTPLKRLAAQPAKGHFVHVEKTGIETFTPQRFVQLM